VSAFINLIKNDYNLNKFFFLFLLLPTSLLPLLLITGPFLPDLCISICAIYMIYVIFFKKKYEYLNFYTIKLFFIFCLYIFLSSFLSKDVYLSLSETLFYVRFGFFSLFIIYLLKNHTNFSYYFTLFAIITFLIIFFDSYFQYFFNYNITGNYYNGFRLNSFFGSELKLGSYIARLTPIIVSLILLYFKNLKVANFLLLLIIINSAIIVLLSGERIAFSLLIFYIFSFFILSKFKIYFKLFIILIIMPLLTVIIFNNNYIKNRMIDDTLNQIFDSKNIGYSFLSRSHSATFKTAFNMFLDKPIHGVGVKNFRILCNNEKYYLDKNNTRQLQDDGTYVKNDYGCFTHPHNNYVQLLAETGFIGFIIILIFFISIFCILFRHFVFLFFPTKKNLLLKNYEISMYLALFITLIPFFPSGNFFNNWLSIIYFIPVGFILFFRSKKVL